jgi:hypothetical protein
LVPAVENALLLSEQFASARRIRRRRRRRYLFVRKASLGNALLFSESSPDIYLLFLFCLAEEVIGAHRTAGEVI